MDSGTILGLDIGGSSLTLGAWQHSGGTLGDRVFWADGIKVNASANDDPKQVCDAIAELVREHSKPLKGSPAALGIGSAGLIKDGVILQSPNTPWDHLPLAEPLSHILDLPVTLINDADAFLLGVLSKEAELPHEGVVWDFKAKQVTAYWKEAL